MDDSMSQSPTAAPEISLAAWKQFAGWVCAALLSVLFLGSGFWKLIDPLATEARMVQMLFPGNVALLIAMGVGITEAWAGILVIVPRWRKWGAALCGLLLLAFMAYMAINYSKLTGADCSCFPWLKRVVGPGFFIGDGVMLLLAVGAGAWARTSDAWKHAAAALGVVVVFAGVMFGVVWEQRSTVKAPPSVTVNGQPFSLQQGRVLVYFFDPECSHCNAAAKDMATYKWKDVKIVAVATVNPQWGEYFVKNTGLPAVLTTDLKLLRDTFKFGDPPYGVALENGRLREALPVFEEKEPKAALTKLGWVE